MTGEEFDKLWALALGQWPKLSSHRSQLQQVAERFLHIDFVHAKTALGAAIFSAGNSWLPSWPDILREAREMQNEANRNRAMSGDDFDIWGGLPPRLRALAELHHESPGKQVLLIARTGETFEVKSTRHGLDGRACQIELWQVEPPQCLSWKLGTRRILSSDAQLTEYGEPFLRNRPQDAQSIAKVTR